jgi:cell division protein FtsL
MTKKSGSKENKKSEGKSKEKKSKKKGNGGKVFLVILLILILAIIIHYVKNQMIFAKIYNTAKDYTSIENYEVKRESTGTDINNTTDAKYLNGLYKVTFTQSDNSKLTMVTMQNKVAIFTEKNGVKTVRFSDKNNVNLNGIIGLENHTFTSNEWYNNCCSMIHTKTEDGKEYYVISGFNSNIMPTVGSHAEVYINKENGLIEKIVETGKDGNEVQTTTYKYEFNNVKTTDLGIPDITSYKLAE